MGLIIEVYRSTRIGGDCTNGGISSRADQLLLVNAQGPFQAEDHPQYPPVMMILNHSSHTLMIVPAIRSNLSIISAAPQWLPVKGTMMGGNYGCASDSRFTQLCEMLLSASFYGAVGIHDRIE